MGRTLHRAVVALAAAALVTLTGCSTAISGTATAATHLAPTAQSSAQPSETSSSQVATTSESTAPDTSSSEPIRPMPPMPSIGGSSDGSSSVPPSDVQQLDDPSITWLAGFCTGFSDVASYSGPDTSGMSDSEIVQTIVDAYDSMSAAAASAKTTLQTLPAPTFPGHDKIVPAALAWFAAVNSVYGKGADTIATGTFTSLDELSAAVNKVESGMDSANTSFGAAIGTVDPSVTHAMKSLQECSTLINSAG